MTKIITSLVLGLALSVGAAYANDTIKQKTGEGAVELKNDTSTNPITGNTTATHEVDTKNAEGNMTSKHKVQIKRGKRGQVLKKDVTNEKMNDAGKTIEKNTTEETHDAK